MFTWRGVKKLAANMFLHQYIDDSVPEDEITAEAKRRKSFEKGLCPNCKHDKFYEGPCGGMSQMLKCCNCNKEYTVAFFNGCCLQANEVNRKEKITT